MTVFFEDSMQAIGILKRLKDIIDNGKSVKALQQTPHLVVLDRSFYHRQMRPVLAEWVLLFMRTKKMGSVEDRVLLNYMIYGPEYDSSGTSKISVGLTDEYMKMLNMAHDLLADFGPFLLSKVNRVNFGLLSKKQIAAVRNMPESRKLTAVPFVGKDVPSRASQFSHPDVVIGLTILSFRFEGLRYEDFRVVLRDLKERLDGEFGNLRKRKSAKLYEKFVELAGGTVKGRELKMDGGEGKGRSSTVSSRNSTQSISYSSSPTKSSPMDDILALNLSQNTIDEDEVYSEVVKGEFDEIWPLHLLDLEDDEHMATTYKLLRSLPHVVDYYLDKSVFPETMEHFGEKISASGQELGGSLLFGRRVGFSGTPSDLLPEELGKCEYEEGVDGKIMNYLTDTNVVSSINVGEGWTVSSLLQNVISTNYHCLIDTGALITGMSNFDVAEFLIDNGLHEKFEGVVFLDEKD